MIEKEIDDYRILDCEDFYETMIQGYIQCINQNFRLNNSRASYIVPAQWVLIVSVLVIPIVIGLVLATVGSSTNQLVKVLVKDAMQYIKNKDMNGALSHLTLADQQISSTNGNSTSKLFIEDAIQNLKNNHPNEAMDSLIMIA